MAAEEVKIKITAEDNASTTFKKLEQNLESA
jgi:hypothetical protein